MPYGSLLADTVQSSTSSPVTFKNTSGTEIGTLCRAWVNFNGTGTVAIRASFNVSSITDNGTGDYTINFTNAMPDVNYCVNGISQTTRTGNNSDFFNIKYNVAPTTTAVNVANFAAGVGFADPVNVCISIFR
jgi:hypothetical protein